MAIKPERISQIDTEQIQNPYRMSLFKGVGGIGSQRYSVRKDV